MEVSSVTSRERPFQVKDGPNRDRSASRRAGPRAQFLAVPARGARGAARARRDLPRAGEPRGDRPRAGAGGGTGRSRSAAAVGLARRARWRPVRRLELEESICGFPSSPTGDSRGWRGLRERVTSRTLGIAVARWQLAARAQYSPTVTAAAVRTHGDGAGGSATKPGRQRCEWHADDRAAAKRRPMASRSRSKLRLRPSPR